MSDREASPSEHGEGRGYAVVVILSLLLILGLLALPFVPLLLALVEGLTLGTQRVEEFCRDIGIHDELSALYRAVFSWMK